MPGSILDDQRGERAGLRANAADAARLFLALWPGAATRRAIVDAAAAWRWPPRARRVPPARLHATLHFLGAVARDHVVTIAEGLGVDFAPCVLHLETAAVWPRGIAVIEAQRVPQPLVELHAALAVRLRALDIAVEARRWRAHVTLARDATRAVATSSMATIDWPVDSYALVESRPGPPASYRVLRRYA
jgi:2'-5' RNA ligase